MYLIWGTTYVAIRVVVSSLPPLLAGGTRFVLAGALLLGALAVRGTPMPAPGRTLGPFITALLMIAGSHGLVATAEVHVSSGQAAVVMSTMPLWIALFQWLAPGGKRPPAMVITGIALGFCGVWLLSRPSGQVQAAPLLSLACAPPLWALGEQPSPDLLLGDGLVVGAVALVLTGRLDLAALRAGLRASHLLR